MSTEMRYEKLKFSGICLLLFFSIGMSASAQRPYTTTPVKMIVGDLKGMAGTYKGYEMLINQASPDFPFYLLLEKSVSYCYFINQYISLRDTNCIWQITINSIEERSFYEHLQKLNRSRTFVNRIIVKSVDLEHSENFKVAFNAIYYMIKKISNDHYQQIADSIYNDNNLVNRAKAKSLILLVDSSHLSYLMTDDSIFQQIKKNLYTTISLGTPYTKSWYKGRENIMLENYSKATQGLNRFCFITDITHMPDYKKNNPFLKKVELKEFGIQCYYPIYFNHYASSTYQQSFYCFHKYNPFRWNKKLTEQFSSKKGAWLMSTQKANYIIISN